LIVRVAAAAPRNRWLQALALRVQANPSLDPGLTVFVIRESAIEAGVEGQIIAAIQRHGFSILGQKTLTATESAQGALLTRGGNWGPGPRDHLGGLPSIVVAAYDPQPLRPSRAQRKRFPLVANARVLVKDAIRNEINESISPRRPINGVHSSDHSGEAHHFMQVFAPELLPAIREEIAKLRGNPVERRQAA
jgi:nucleoside diphosphate kinase